MSPRLLVLAGHDPTGRAGIDADRAAAHHFGAETLCVVSAWTRQAGARVLSIGARSAREWLADAHALALEGGPIAGLKTGLLPSEEAVRAAARLISELRERFGALPVVCDPVLAATGGEAFLDAAAIEAWLTVLIPAGPIVTPNLSEAGRLSGLAPERLADPGARIVAAEALLERGAAAVVLKGGHGAEDPVQDLVLERGQGPAWCEHPRIGLPGQRGTRGSGCRFASALAAQVARGVALPVAAAAAGRWVAELIAKSGVD